jgi:drug/metabolite transporter (DMT)-like permease
MSSTHALKMRLAPWALLLVSASWGLAFVVMKDAIERQSVNSFLFTRFLVAVIAMFLLKPTVIQSINREVLRKGFIAGLFLAAGYILQTLGLALTGAAVTGFITGLYVVATPVLAALVLRVRITAFTWGCVLLATAGLARLSLKGWNLGYGEFLVF